MQAPYIDIILLSYGKFATTTKPCLDSLLPDCNNPNYCLTVVDNCSPDNSANEIREYLKYYPYIRTSFLEKNTGFAGGMNFGASLATAEWLLLVNSDTIFAPGALDTLYHSLLAQPPRVDMMGPVTNAAGNGQGYPFKGTAADIFQQAKFISQFPCHGFIPCYRLDFFCVAIRKSLWDKLHGLDPIFGLGYYEDTDFSMRAKEIGTKMLICEDAFVYHVGGSSFSDNPQARALIKRNKNIFKRRHPHAILYHNRQDNLAVLEEYLKLYQQGVWNEGLAIRTELRIKALKTNLPRSLIKKWLWQHKVNKMLQSLAVISTTP